MQDVVDQAMASAMVKDWRYRWYSNTGAFDEVEVQRRYLVKYLSFKQCFGYAGLEEVGGEHLVLVAWEVSLFVFFNFRMSLNFRVDISLRRPARDSIAEVIVRQGRRLRCASKSLAVQARLYKTKGKCKLFPWFLISR